MRSRYSLILLIGVFVVPFQAEVVVSVATHNICFLELDIYAARANRITTVIERIQADVIGLQEINDRDVLERVFDPANWQQVLDRNSNDRQDLAVDARRPLVVLDLRRHIVHATYRCVFFIGMCTAHDLVAYTHMFPL